MLQQHTGHGQRFFSLFYTQKMGVSAPPSANAIYGDEICVFFVLYIETRVFDL